MEDTFSPRLTRHNRKSVQSPVEVFTSSSDTGVDENKKPDTIAAAASNMGTKRVSRKASSTSRSVKAATNERDLSEPTDMPMADVQTSESILHARVPNSAHVVSAAKASPLGLAKNKPMQHTQRKGRAKTSSGKVSGTRTGERASRSIMSYFGAKNVDKPVVVSEGVVAVKGVGAQVARSGRNNGGRAGRRLQIGKSNAECVDLTAEEGPDSGSNSEQGSSDTSGIIGPIPANVQPTVEQALPEKAGSGSDTNANSSLPTTGPSGTGDGEACASMDVDEEPRTTGTAIANEMAEKASTTNEIADKEMNTNDRKAADICTNVQSSTAKVGEAATVQVDSGEEEMASTHPREQERSSERSSVHTIVPTATKDTPEEIPKNSEAGIAEMYLGVDKGESVNETEGLSAGEGDEVVAMETEELQKTAAKEASLTFPLYTIVWAKMYSYPAWPAMITMDANTGEVERMRNDLLEVHTVFLDKKCSRGWIPATAIEVISTADMIENGPGEKLQMKVIKGGQKKKRKVMSTSNAALAEATRVLAMNVAERTAFNPFPYREPEPEPSPPPRKVIKGKREPTQKAPKVERPVKRRKTEEEIAEEKREKAAERAKLLRERREMESEARRQRKELEQKENAENLAQKEAQMEPIPTVDPTVCYACHKAGDLVACQAPNCNKYHVECVKKLPLAQFLGTESSFLCPRHMCATCDRNVTAAESIRCTHCHIAYHNDECIPGACIKRTSGREFTCCSHGLKPGPKLSKKNIDWCKICAEGGELICCDTCAASVHATCISGTYPLPGLNDDILWKCPECDEGKIPLVDDVVFAKLGNFRWWPAKILDRDNLADNMERKTRTNACVPVYFFGSHDMSWMPCNHMTSYRSDIGCTAKKNGAFSRALVETEAHIVELDEKKREREAVLESKDPVKPYRKITRNNWLVKKPVTEIDESHFECKCKDEVDPETNAINRCYDERCENRMTMTECTKADCNIDTCNNMRLSKRQYANVNVFKTASGKAWGLGSKSELKAGQLVIEYVGEVIDTQTVQQRLAQAKETGCDDFYMLGMDNQLYIDAQFKGNLARFMNHSCDPNCETQKWRVNGEIRIGIFAMKDIRKDEELTFNYQFDTFGNEASKVCRCESANCSGFLGMKPKKKNSGAMSTQESGQKHRVKKSLKKRKVRVEKITEDECYHCGDDGSLTLCDMNFCPKAYHVGCLGLEKAPHGQWHCPWHQCSQCSKKSTRFCVGCPTSTCDACSVQTELMGHVQRKLTAGAKSTRTFGLCSECTQEAGVSPDSATEHVATIIDKVLLNTQLHRSSGSRHRKTKSTQAQAHTLTTHTVEPIKRQTKRSVQAMEPLVLSDMEDDVSSEQSGSGLKQRDESSAPPRLSTTTPSEDTQKSSSGEEPAQTVAGPNMAQPRAEMSVDKDERSDRDSQVLASGSSIESNGDLAMSDDSGNASVSSHTESAVSAKSNSVMASEKAGVVSIVEDSLGESSACA